MFMCAHSDAANGLHLFAARFVDLAHPDAACRALSSYLLLSRYSVGCQEQVRLSGCPAAVVAAE